MDVHLEGKGPESEAGTPFRHRLSRATAIARFPMMHTDTGEGRTTQR